MRTPLAEHLDSGQLAYAVITHHRSESDFATKLFIQVYDMFEDKEDIMPEGIKKTMSRSGSFQNLPKENTMINQIIENNKSAAITATYLEAGRMANDQIVKVASKKLPLMARSGKANLDDIAKELHHQLKNGDDISFVIQSKKSDETIQLKFDIVKHIIDVRLAEQSAAETLRSNKEKKQQLLAIIAQKENEGLMNTSLDELKKMAESL